MAVGGDDLGPHFSLLLCFSYYVVLQTCMRHQQGGMTQQVTRHAKNNVAAPAVDKIAASS